MAAPSASDRKPWHFVVVQDHDLLTKLAAAHPFGKMLAAASHGIVVCGDPGISDWWIQDCTAATENILIATSAIGLGAVWLGCQGRPEREEAIREVLGIPRRMGILSLLSIGYPAEKKEPRTQYDQSRVHRNGW